MFALSSIFSNSHFHFVIRYSIAGISLTWRLAVNNRWNNNFIIARWRM